MIIVSFVVVVVVFLRRVARVCVLVFFNELSSLNLPTFFVLLFSQRSFWPDMAGLRCCSLPLSSVVLNIDLFSPTNVQAIIIIA